MELLWTDWFFLSLLLAVLLALFNALRKPAFSFLFKQFLEQPRALCSGIILVFFLSIAVLDSIHLRVDFDDGQVEESDKIVGQLVSVLDTILAPQGQVYERTYSAPLALTLLQKETFLVKGRLEQRRMPLEFLSGRIQTEAQKQVFLWKSAAKALCYSLIVSLGAAWLLARKKYSLWAALTLGVSLFLVLFSYYVSRELHLLGTGKIGQDIFYYTVKSIRTGVIIGTLTTIFLLPFALILGIAAGYFGGILDDIIQYIYTTLSSIPGVLLITASVLSMQTYISNHPLEFSTLDKAADARLLALCLILGITSWTSLCRLLRAEVLKLREIDFVLASQALGSSIRYIFQKHLLPNVMPIVLITLVLDFSYLVLAEAVLSYVGVGVSPLTISWGNMINGARLELASDPVIWWPMFSAFILMFVLILSSNIFADTLRDTFDPQNRRNL